MGLESPPSDEIGSVNYLRISKLIDPPIHSFSLDNPNARESTVPQIKGSYHVRSSHSRRHCYCHSKQRRFGGQQGQCPATEDVSDRLLRLPFYNDLAAEDLEYVVQSVRSSFPAG